LRSLIGFAICLGFRQAAKTIQRQGEIFLRLVCAQAGTLKIETLLVTFGVNKSN